MEHNCCSQFSMMQFSATSFCYLTMEFWDVLVSSSGVAMPKNEHGHFDPWKWVNITLSWNVKNHSPSYNVTFYKNVNVNLLDFQTAVLKQVSRPFLPLLVIGLSIMIDILFHVNTVLLPVSIIHFSSHVMCSMCIWLCECRAHLRFVFFFLTALPK